MLIARRSKACVRRSIEKQNLAWEILDHRGQWFFSPLYPLAHLGLARAASLTGDTTKRSKAYDDFFALWKDADPDLPLLQEARREREAHN